MNDVERFLREDLGRTGDVTTRLVMGAKVPLMRARLYAREPVIAAGVKEAAAVFRTLGCRIVSKAREGRSVPAGSNLMIVLGRVDGILAGERLALNFLGRMCGIATTTRRLQERVQRINRACHIASTRKTTPGFRWYEKRAVALGGGDPHRFGLFDAVLIKDNHVALVGSVAEAVRRAKRRAGRQPVEVEVSTVRDALAAARAGANWVLVDNVTPARARLVARALRRDAPNVRIEISGGLDEHNVARYAKWAHRLSLGSLTHSARSADVTLDLELPKR